MKTKPYHLLFGSFFAFTAVLIGAFGAHGLDGVLSPEQLDSFETGVRYQMYHALALIMISLKGHTFHLKYERLIATLFGIGIVLFSGSIYLLNLQDVLGVNLRLIGLITPLGGTLFIVAWGLLMTDAIQLIGQKKR